jgi:RNA polymerase sigma-70 factor, ECF subfamily
MGAEAVNGQSAQAQAARLHLHDLRAIVSFGDSSAFVALFNYYVPRVKTYMRRLGASHDLAEELAQEVMLTVWHKASTYDPAKAAVNTWIFTLARNLRIDAIRRARRADLLHNDPAVAPEPVATPDTRFVDAEAEARMHSALGELPRDQAVIIGLAFYEGKSHGQIADELAIPLGTVKSRLRLAYQRIRHSLAEPALAA